MSFLDLLVHGRERGRGLPDQARRGQSATAKDQELKAPRSEVKVAVGPNVGTLIYMSWTTWSPGSTM